MRFFKTGFVFLAWLSGHQDHFRMVWGEQSARSVPHLSKVYRLADQLGLFPDPELAERRMRVVLATMRPGLSTPAPARPEIGDHRCRTTRSCSIT